jgi:hypothetical protein
MHHITCDVLCAGINNQQEWGMLTHEREHNMFDRLVDHSQSDAQPVTANLAPALTLCFPGLLLTHCPVMHHLAPQPLLNASQLACMHSHFS